MRHDTLAIVLCLVRPMINLFSLTYTDNGLAQVFRGFLLNVFYGLEPELAHSATTLAQHNFKCVMALKVVKVSPVCMSHSKK